MLESVGCSHFPVFFIEDLNMHFNTPFRRFLFGAACALVVIVIGFAWVTALIPTWGATAEEIHRNLPGDEIIAQPQYAWNHAITIQAPPEQIFPWLAQMGDTRGAYYSFTFIENLFMLAGKSSDRYVNADRIHEEWQNPPVGQGMIFKYVAVADYKTNAYVLATATPEMPGFGWTWLWYLQPVDQNSTRLIVRHRFDFPETMPFGLIKTVFDLGYVMERGMMLGIRERAEGNIPSALEEPFAVLLWLVAFTCGVISAVQYVRSKRRLHPLGIGLEALVVLFIFTYIQPPIWMRVLLDLVLIASVVSGYLPGGLARLVFRKRD